MTMMWPLPVEGKPLDVAARLAELTGLVAAAARVGLCCYGHSDTQANEGAAPDMEELGARTPSEIRMGISNEFCTMGSFGPKTACTPPSSARMVNLAACLEKLSEPGEILVSLETFSLIKYSIMFQEIHQTSSNLVRRGLPPLERAMDRVRNA